MHRILVISLLTFSTFIFIIDIPSTSAVKSYGDSCNKRKDCDSAKGLTCLKNSCQCSRPESNVYSESARACLIRIGRRCDEVKNGTSSSSSSSSDSEGNTTEYQESSTTAQPANSGGVGCIENADCKKLRARHWCQCRENFIPNAEGTECRSMAKYGEFCDEHEDQCDRLSGAVCIDGNCQCPFSDHQYFDQYEGICKSFAGGNCSVPKMSPCVPNADCTSAQVRMGYTTEKGIKKIHTKTVTQCLCKSGYSQTSNGFCFGAYMTSCSSKQPCSSEDHLACVDGKCKCRNPLHEMVDENTGSCMALVGTVCDPRRGPRCVDNAECIDNHCECNGGFSITPKKTCLLDYKEPCTPNSCNNYSGLACIKGKCDCFDSYLLYDVSTKACVGVSSSSDE
ncbi:Tenascin-X [Orchesella cincta]|uniref:Tenascin-X n=1 Tax=Orchesella cincta TaxID=48709 RepID=A0A1D2N3L3_ORCCI|nr:Tenascin-X [Orchesella cincta]